MSLIQTIYIISGLGTFASQVSIPNLQPTVGQYKKIICEGKPAGVPDATYEWWKGESALPIVDGRIAVDQRGEVFMNVKIKKA